MPSFSTLAVASVLALGALARPGMEKRGGYGYCLDRNEAQLVATNYGQLIASYTKAQADAALSADFTDFSESVNSLIVGFNNLTQFENGQGQQAPINFYQLNMWHSCDTVIIRWETTNTANITGVRPVVGLISMETVEAPTGNLYPYQISTVYSEFDSAAWLANIEAAGFCAPPANASITSIAASSPAPTASPTSTPNTDEPTVTPTPYVATSTVQV
ncbi:hypothetical protein LTR87_012556 [Friedmanniomyces endolithicus]|nr:hypothetical protein LTR87_012556 [Friedmanniomyces endolithicus]